MKGQPPVAPGHSTRQERRQPRLIVHTGDGKGKSTAAFGLALRGWNRGWSIGVFQFIKSPKWPAGERAAFAALQEAHERTGVGGPVRWEVLGEGWTWRRGADAEDDAALARRGWAAVREAIEEQRHDLLVLDEVNHVLAKGWVPVDEAVAVLTGRPGVQHVVCTGRRAPAALLDAADLVTEFAKVKHPFDTGAKGQAGIEW